MTESVGWGVIGPGRRAREAVIPALLSSASSKLVGVCGQNPERTQESAQNWEGARIFENVDDLTKDPEVDVVYIATPHFYHVPQAVAVIESGKNVFMESPMALSVDGANKLVEKARIMNVSLGIAFQYRFHSAIKALKSALENNEIGDLRHLSIQLSDPLGDDVPQWWMDSFRAGPIALLRLGVHAIDLAAWLAGRPVAEVAAMGKETGDEHLNTLAGALIRFEDQTMANIMCATEFCEKKHRLAVEGDQGCIILEGDLNGKAPVTMVKRKNGGQEQKVFETEDPTALMVEAFSQSAANKTEFHPDGTDGKKEVRITCAIIDSIKSKRVTRLGEGQRTN